MTTDFLTITLTGTTDTAPLSFDTDSLTFEDVQALLVRLGFVFSTTEDDDDVTVHTFVRDGQSVDVTIWDVTPDGFSPVASLPLALTA